MQKSKTIGKKSTLTSISQTFPQIKKVLQEEFLFVDYTTVLQIAIRAATAQEIGGQNPFYLSRFLPKYFLVNQANSFFIAP